MTTGREDCYTQRAREANRTIPRQCTTAYTRPIIQGEVGTEMPAKSVKKATAVADAAAREAKILKLAGSIIDPNCQSIQLRSKFKLINRDNKKEACTLRDPCIGLNLLQIAVIADNVTAGAL